jgi:hypothetical protein
MLGVGGRFGGKGSDEGERRRGIVGFHGKGQAYLLLESIVDQATSLLGFVWLLLLRGGNPAIGLHWLDLS